MFKLCDVLVTHSAPAHSAESSREWGQNIGWMLVAKKTGECGLMRNPDRVKT